MNQSSETISSPKKRGSKLLNIILLLVVIGAIALFVWTEKQRREVNSKLNETTQQLEEIRKSTQRSGQEVANEVLAKLRKHMDIPTDPQPTVATIIDVEKLRQNSDFYKKANNGDNLIITANRAILYNPQTDIILDVVPVRIDQSQTSPTVAPATSATPRPTVSPTPLPT